MESSFFLPFVRSGIFPGRVSVVKNASNLINTDFAELISLSEEVIQKFREQRSIGQKFTGTCRICILSYIACVSVIKIVGRWVK